MKHVSFEEYEAAKAEIIGGVHYIEKSTMENDVIHKTYSTEENGTFYEVNDKGRVEFWSDKHSESRIYDENERATETDKKAGPGYGDLLAERIRANADASKLTDFEKFVLDRGYMFAYVRNGSRLESRVRPQMESEPRNRPNAGRVHGGSGMQGPQAGHLAGGLPGHFGTHQGRAADRGCADGLCVLRMVSEKAGSNHRVSDRNGKRHAGSPEMGGQ